MYLFKDFQKQISQQHLFLPKDKLILAVSGGVDSVVLCELCKQAGYDFIIAHCNFKLRGTESDRDEQFVKGLGEKYKVEVIVKKFETDQYATENKISIQEAARALRYEWFDELVNSIRSESGTHHPIAIGSSFTIHLLTAHHADDNNETLLMNFFRGTGLHGLTGIPASYGYIKRPMLSISKETILQFAKEYNLEFVEDSSNQSSKYTRNFFRNELIPAISKVYPRVKENLQDNINRFKEIEKLYHFSVGETKKKLYKQKSSEIHIPVKQLMQFQNRALIYEIISEFGFNEKQVDELIKLASSDSGKYIESPLFQYRIIKHRHWFIISPVQSETAENIIIEDGNREILFSAGELSIRTVSNLPRRQAGLKLQSSNFKPHSSNESVSVDAKDIQFPLLLRKRKAGDYFYPLGRKKKKKISRFLIDQKLSKTEKENIWVIECNKKIIWVVGQRIDDRFKLTEATKEILAFRFTAYP